MDELESKPKWIDFIDKSDPNNKTKKFWVINKDHNYTLGEIRWYGAFRKYSFFPNDNSVFDSGCLRSIIQFMDELMVEYKKTK